METLTKPRPRLQYTYGEDEYGPMHTVGIPPECHTVLDILDLELDIDLRTEIAAVCRSLGAPPATTDHDFAWLDTTLDEERWLWISYRPDYRPHHMLPEKRTQTG